MADSTQLTEEQFRTAAAVAGVSISDEALLMLPLMNELLAAMRAADGSALRETEPSLIHDVRRRGPA